MTTLICLDRDGTLLVDENYYLGSQENWRELMEFMQGVPQGLRLLNTLPDTYLAITSMQSGVARTDKPLLTQARVKEVHDELVRMLDVEGAHVDAAFYCPFVDAAYNVKHLGDVNEFFLKPQHQDIKPRVGMVRKAIKELHMTEPHVYMIGDRASDIKMAINAKGTGILVPAHKTGELGDIAAVEALAKEHPGHAIIRYDFLEAAKYIFELEERIRTSPTRQSSN